MRNSRKSELPLALCLRHITRLIGATIQWRQPSICHALALCIALATLCGACSAMHERDFEEANEEADLPVGYTLRVSLDPVSAPASRTNPNGGESGNGNVAGTTAENTISNALVLMLPKSITDPSVTADDKVLATFYFNSFTLAGGYYVSEKLPINFRIEEMPTKVYLIVIANAGNLGDIYADMSMQMLRRNLYADKPWTGVVADANNFVMTSCNDAQLSLAKTDNPQYASSTFTATAKVERLCARIDFATALVTTGTDEEINYKNGGITFPAAYSSLTAGIRYPVYSRNPSTGVDSKNTNEYFLLTDFEVLNAYIGSSYLIKRTAADIYGNSGVVFFGNEGTGTISEKYVVSPLDVTESNFTVFPTNINTVVDGGAKDYSTPKSYTVAYVRENTNREEHYTTLRLGGFIGTVTGSSDWNYSGAKRQTYDIVLRHSDPTGTGATTDVMHYGVVRNNIYRVAIDKIVRISVKELAVYWYYYGGENYVVFSTNFISDIGEGSDPPDD